MFSLQRSSRVVFAHLPDTPTAHTRCFTFGIGTTYSSALVDGIARASNGFAEGVSEVGGGALEQAVLRQLGRALCPALCDVQLEWNPPWYDCVLM